MNVVIFAVLAIVTIAYLIVASVMDIKERMIYVFPAMVLHIACPPSSARKGPHSTQ